MKKGRSGRLRFGRVIAEDYGISIGRDGGRGLTVRNSVHMGRRAMICSRSEGETIPAGRKRSCHSLPEKVGSSGWALATARLITAHLVVRSTWKVRFEVGLTI